LGRGAAVAQFEKFTISGFLAWLIWLLVHITYLVSFRSRLVVMFEWAWVYVRNERGARLITGAVEPLLQRGTSEHHR
jgi:NADH dehydrogenase